MFINLVNNLMIYLRTDRPFEHGSMVEMLLILFAPVFVNRKYFYLVSFSVIGKYVFFHIAITRFKSGNSTCFMYILFHYFTFFIKTISILCKNSG